MSQVETGTVLGGKYRLEALIGRGGMGSVWRAEHLGLNAPVAVKLLDSVGAALATELLQRFYREARAAANIRSPHVVQILDHGVDEALGEPFIVMELMEGESLAQRLARSGRLSPAQVAHVFTQVARALSRAHEAGIVHRDLKPDNVFLVRNEDEIVAKVLDFGIAKAQAHGLHADSGTRTGAVMGTAFYMSPEQISGTKNVDFRTDLWAFGVMACECLTGKRPFDADSVGGLTLKICIDPVPNPSRFALVPAGFDDWFLRSVSRDPAQRFGSAREAADALREVLTSERASARAGSSAGFSVPPPSAPTLLAPAASFTTGPPLSVTSNGVAARGQANPLPKRKNPKAALLLAAVGVVVAGSVGALWLRHSGGSVDPSEPASTAGPVTKIPAAPIEVPAELSAAAPPSSAPVLVPGLDALPEAGPSPSPSPSASTRTASSKPAESAARQRPPAANLKGPPPKAALAPRTPPTAATPKAPSVTGNPVGPARDVIDDRH
jgi:eukaryotic-like serine/threonine-protein kinase